MSRKVLWLVFSLGLALILGLKAVQLGWFAPRLPLELNGEPALLFFNKARGCECELLVYNNANTQIDSWNVPVRVIRVDLDRRPDLAQQYGVIRAPSLVLLDEMGSVVWKQDEGLSDEAPLDLEQVEVQVEALGQNL
ncbi:MAG: hypothetical protein JW963_08490 [Anaerolineales bacterium]|nr:hypothetical protein [Anaerolineales bacterium]